jgi:hypothetical protein
MIKNITILGKQGIEMTKIKKKKKLTRTGCEDFNWDEQVQEKWALWMMVMKFPVPQHVNFLNWLVTINSS